MVDSNDPLQMKLSTGEKWLAGIVGGIVLLAASYTAVVGAWQDWAINSVAIGALFAISLVLLVLGVTGRLPATVSVSDKGFALGYLAGVEDTAQKAAEVNQKALATARSLPEQPAIKEAVVDAQNLDQARDTIASEIVQRIVGSLPTNPEEFIPDAAVQARRMVEGLGRLAPR